MEIELIIVSPFLIVFSLGMLITAFVSYKRSKNSKLIFVSFAFLLFLIKGVFMAVTYFFQETAEIATLSSFGFLDVIIVVFLFMATLKR